MQIIPKKPQRVVWCFVGLILLAFCGSFFLGRDGLIRYFELRRELKRTEQEIVLSREQNSELRRHLESLQKGDSLALEEEARRHRLVGPNEEIYEVEVK